MAGTYGAMAVDSPDVFKGNVAKNHEGYPYVTGTAFSSHQPASWWMQPLVLDAPMAIANIYVYKSINAVIPGKTSQNSSGTYLYSYKHGVTLFSRQNNDASSTNLSAIKTGSGGFFAGLTVSSSSQSFSMGWVTDSTGGMSTISTTSAGAGNYSSSLTGNKIFPIPFVTALPVGEYFIAHQHSSTTAGTQSSNVTIMSFSNLHIAPQLLNYGVFGGTNATEASLGGPAGIGLGVASVMTTNATVAASVVSANVVQYWVMNFSAV